MNVLVSCDYQDGSAAGAGKSLAMCFGAIVALSKMLKSVSGVTIACPSIRTDGSHRDFNLPA